MNYPDHTSDPSEMTPGTAVWATASIEQGMRGVIVDTRGDLRKVNFQHWWAWLAVWQLKKPKA